MSAGTYTPGPWMAYNAQGGRIFKKWRIHRPGARVIAEICENNSTEIEAANARLIAAAPDLLADAAALLAVVDEVVSRCGWMDHGERERMWATIKRARGMA